MAVLWCGAEDIDFPNGVPVSATTGAGAFRAGFARCAIFNSQPPQGLAKSTVFPAGAIQSGWISWRMRNDNHGNDQTLSTMVGFGSSGTNKGIFMGTTFGATNGLGLQLCSYDGSVVTVLATTGAFANNPLTNGVIYRFDLQMISYGVAGSSALNLFVNGGLLLSFTGSFSIAGVSGLDSVFMGGGYNVSFNNTPVFSEFMVANESTLGWQGLATAAPSGNGTTQQWSNPDYTNFNPITINDANATFTNTVGQDEQATLIALPAGNYAIKAVKAIARAAAPSGAVPTNIKLGFKSSTTVGVGLTLAVPVAFTPVEQIFATDPTTGAAWGSFSGYQINLRSA
jgi:hypothetical protein